jgi:hypothetical protein
MGFAHEQNRIEKKVSGLHPSTHQQTTKIDSRR